MRRSFHFSALLLFIFALSTQAQQQSYKLDDVLKPDPKITMGKLENGLTYYIRENKSQRSVLSFD